MVHSVALPQMCAKHGAIPGIAQPAWFTPTPTGEWEIACSQLCGLGDYRTRAFYTVHTRTDHDAWFAEEMALFYAPESQ
jgi:cytochrome c oxidase subunit 2